MGVEKTLAGLEIAAPAKRASAAASVLLTLRAELELERLFVFVFPKPSLHAHLPAAQAPATCGRLPRQLAHCICHTTAYV